MESLVLQKKNLGHGGISRSIKDIKILKALQQQGIISRIYPW